VTATVSYDPATNSAFLDPNVRPGRSAPPSCSRRASQEQEADLQGKAQLRAFP
jgi:hypothetical protein